LDLPSLNDDYTDLVWMMIIKYMSPRLIKQR